MAITKLLNIKQAGNGKSKAVVLQNAIDYILNPEKTQGGELMGSNCGRDATSIFEAMLETKSYYSKWNGRQGYHFIISFSEDEKVSAETMLNVMNEFSEAYLGDAYDYVYTVHDDQPHMHGHLVFNSVNRNTGYKYRYENGDWANYIQPITNKICEKYGLEQIDVFFREDKKEESKINPQQKLKADMDECINNAVSYEEFLQQMKNMYHYEIREGISKKHGHYLSFKKDGFSAIRSYRLKGYSPADIARKIQLQSGHQKTSWSNNRTITTVVTVKKYRLKLANTSYLKWQNMSKYQKERMIKIIKARQLYGYTATPRWQNERDVAEINRMMSDIAFMRKNDIADVSDAKRYIERISADIDFMKNEVSKIKKEYSGRLKWDAHSRKRSDFNLIKEYLSLQPETELKRIHEIESTMDVRQVLQEYNDYMTVMNECMHSIREGKSNIKTAKRIVEEMDQGRQKNKDRTTAKEKAPKKAKKWME